MKSYTYNIILMLLLIINQSCTEKQLNKNARLEINGNNITEINFGYAEEYTIVKIISDTDWTLSCNESWCTISNTSGKKTNGQYIRINVKRNTSEETRNAIIELRTNDNNINYTVKQLSKNDYDFPTNMNKDAIEIAKEIKIGWNLGNSLEAIGGETAWGNPRTTKEIIDGIKELGFNAIRIPCSWDQYLLEDNIIDPLWMSRVKEVVDYCINNHMYTILNIHWDGGWIESACNALTTNEEEIKNVEKKIKDIWEQIANEFINYDEYLIFAETNEPSAKNKDDMTILKRYYQAFIDAVRNSGGNNEYRNLIIQGPSTNIDYTCEFMEFPKDYIPSRILLEVHYYTPYNFCINDGNDPINEVTYFWGKEFKKYGKVDEEYQEEYVLNQFNKIKNEFVDKGIPIVLGEYSLILRQHPDKSLQEKCEESEGYFLEYITKNAKDYGMIPFLWDNGSFYNREEKKFNIQKIYEMIMSGAKNGKYPF